MKADAPTRALPSPDTSRTQGNGSRSIGFFLRTVSSGYLLLLVALPLSAVLWVSLQDGPGTFWEDVTHPVAWAALQLTLVISVVAMVINTLMGTLTAWVLVRYTFPGKTVLNSLVDLPFAVPTLVTGIMLVALYGPQTWIGGHLEAFGISIIFAKPGILLALLMVTYPFVVRAVQPSLEQLDRAHEEAAYTIGANRRQTFRHVVLPEILPAVISGALLTFSRCIGEFGSVVIVAGNIPGRTLTAPVYVYSQIESDLPRSAAAVSVVLLAASILLLFLSGRLQRRPGEGREKPS
ncbi:MAG TPA: sulfate ABC transporter permease subunit CysT [Acidobacteriota bacterium]|nr:sulfate ABC transporter permease subunit CysT [Acidobacteriota bacterium]HRR55428.1 sulfate ABC transporter permease subunit CysT [Acidobacteriota bacterium]